MKGKALFVCKRPGYCSVFRIQWVSMHHMMAFERKSGNHERRNLSTLETILCGNITAFHSIPFYAMMCDWLLFWSRGQGRSKGNDQRDERRTPTADRRSQSGMSLRAAVPFDRECVRIATRLVRRLLFILAFPAIWQLSWALPPLDILPRPIDSSPLRRSRSLLFVVTRKVGSPHHRQNYVIYRY